MWVKSDPTERPTSQFLNEAPVPAGLVGLPHPFILPRSLSFPSVFLSADCVRFVSHNLVRPRRAGLFIPSKVTLGHCAAVHFGQRDWKRESERESFVHYEACFRGRKNKVLLAKHIRHKTQILTGFLDWWNMMSGSLSQWETATTSNAFPFRYSARNEEHGQDLREQLIRRSWLCHALAYFYVNFTCTCFIYRHVFYLLRQRVLSDAVSCQVLKVLVNKTALGWSRR